MLDQMNDLIMEVHNKLSDEFTDKQESISVIDKNQDTSKTDSLRRKRARESTEMGLIEKRLDCLKKFAEDLNLKTVDYEFTQPK